MQKNMKTFHALIAGGLLLASGWVGQSVASANETEPTWSGSVIARGEERKQIRSLPIEERPYRPLHFYGNTVRRMHYRGTPLPTVPEVVTLPARVVTQRR